MYTRYGRVAGVSVTTRTWRCRKRERRGSVMGSIASTKLPSDDQTLRFLVSVKQLLGVSIRIIIKRSLHLDQQHRPLVVHVNPQMLIT